MGTVNFIQFVKNDETFFGLYFEAVLCIMLSTLYTLTAKKTLTDCEL